MASDTENQLAATVGQEILEDGHPKVSDSPHQNKKKISLPSDPPLPIKVLMVVLATPFLLPIIAFGIALAAFIIALLPLFLMLATSLPEKTRRRWMREDGHGVDNPREPGVGGIYNQARCKKVLWYRIALSSRGMSARVGLAMLVGLGLSIFVPGLKRVTLLGSPLWKWSLLSVTLSVGHVQAFFATNVFVFGPIYTWAEDNIVTQYTIGLNIQVTHVMYMGMALVSWLVYFRTEQGLKHASTPHPRAFEYVTWTFVSLLVGSILFLLKGLLLAKWSADAIYRRFEPRILITSVKYFFIGLAAAGFHERSILGELKVLKQYGTDKDDRNGSNDPNMDSRKLSVTKYIMSRRTKLGYLRRVSHILKSLAEIMSPILDRDNEDNDEEEEVVSWFNDKIKPVADKCTPALLIELFHRTEKHAEAANHSPSTSNAVAGATETSSGSNGAEPSSQADGQPADLYKRQRKKYRKMANVLHRLVREEISSVASDFTFGDLNMWMVDAHKDCINMGRTLADANAIVSRVDLLLSCVIVLIVLLLWLLITGFASTTVLVTIATSLLALTFIFGDAAKTFFQGLIFCFATHPFDVGDRCILDDIELEVKRVNILTTKFTKIGSKEKRLYSNAVLATKPILNLGWQPDSKDVVELTLNPSTDLEKLKGKITKFFKDEENCSKYKNSCEMMIKELGDNVKVTIHFSHILTVHDLSHNQCFKKKNLQRFDLLNMIKNHINNKSETEEVVHDMPSLDPSRSSQSSKSEIQDMGNMETKTQCLIESKRRYFVACVHTCLSYKHMMYRNKKDLRHAI